MPSSPSPSEFARLILCGSLVWAGCGGSEPREEIEEVADPASAPVMADDASMASVGIPFVVVGADAIIASSSFSMFVSEPTASLTMSQNSGPTLIAGVWTTLGRRLLV